MKYQHNGNQILVAEMTEQGMSATEIAKVLGIAPSTVYVHRHKARARKAKEQET